MAVRQGLDPLIAVQMATLNPAEHFGLKDRGAIAAGYIADLVVLDDLKDFEVTAVYKDGRKVAVRGKTINFPLKAGETHGERTIPLNILPLHSEHFRIPHEGGKARVIKLVSGQITTAVDFREIKSMGGWAISDTASDILKLAVIERHHGTGRVGLGFVNGFGLKRGALASSVAHDSHNVIVVGVHDDELLKAVEEVKMMGGGLAVVSGRETIARMPLEIAGLMSKKPLDVVVRELRTVKAALATLGCTLDEPFMTLSFLALPVIPELKLTDKGLVDVNRFEIVPLFLEK